MSLELWTAVDHYITKLLVPPDPILEATLKRSLVAGLPPINVTPPQGRLLMLLGQLAKAHKILEIGTLGGYSTIWLARALPADGHLITLEVDPKHAKVALANIAQAGLKDIVELRPGKALDTLPKLAKEGRGPFDVIFIDADRKNYPEYFTWALKLSHRGSVIIVDNVVRDGKVVDASSSDPSIQGVRHLNTLLASESCITVTEIQTVGSKGYDGFAIAFVTADK